MTNEAIEEGNGMAGAAFVDRPRSYHQREYRRWRGEEDSGGRGAPLLGTLREKEREQ
jgi:hypothetical protein